MTVIFCCIKALDNSQADSLNLKSGNGNQFHLEKKKRIPIR